MANEYDYESGSGGAGFVVGLLTGTALGAGLGMLFAPKSGSELRGKISESATHMGEKGRVIVDKARDAVSRGSEEARRLGEKASHMASSATGSSASGSSSNIGGSSSPGGSNPGSPYSSGPTRG